MNFTGPIQATGGQVFSENSAPLYALGTEAVTRDGGKYRYVKAGVAALVAGQLMQSPAQIAAHQQLVVVAAGVPPVFPDVNTFTITVTNGAAPVSAGYYVNGYAIIDTGPGLGGRYSILSHNAALAAAPLTITLQTDDPLFAALTTASRVSLQAGPYNGVIQNPAVGSGAVVGVAVYPLTGGSYGWLQTGGLGAVLVTGTPAAGSALSPSATAGAAGISAAGLPNIGTIQVTGIAGKVQAVLLDI